MVYPKKRSVPALLLSQRANRWLLEMSCQWLRREDLLRHRSWPFPQKTHSALHLLLRKKRQKVAGILQGRFAEPRAPGPSASEKSPKPGFESRATCHEYITDMLNRLPRHASQPNPDRPIENLLGHGR
jgi:hypothetical protein